MLDEFVKLNRAKTKDSLYLRPESIFALDFHHDDGDTDVTCALCDKVRKKMQKGGMWI